MPFQYQSGGQLIDPMFQAAASIGQSHHGMADPMMDILNFNRQSQQQADQNVLQAQQLQAAHEQMLAGIAARQRPSAPTTAIRGAAPSVSETLRKKLIASSIAPDDLTPEQQQLVKDVINKPDITADHLKQTLDPIIQANRQKKAMAAQEEKEKAIELYRQQQESAKEKAAVDAELNRQAASQRGAAESDRRSVREKMEQIGDLLRKQGVDPDGPATQPNLMTKQQTPWYDYVLPGDQSTPAKPIDDLSLQHQEYQRLKQQAQQSAGPAPEGKQLDPQTAIQFYQQAGGDPNKARELARQAGYQI